MDYDERPPRPELAPWVRCIWTLRSSSVPGRAFEAAPEGEAGEPDKVVPDGYPEIILNFADPFGEPGPDGAVSRQPWAVVAGQITRPLWLVPGGEIDLLGIRFESSGLYPLLGLALSELRDDRVALEDVSPRLARSLAGCRAAQRSRRIERVEACVLASLDARTSKTDGRVAEGVRWLRESSGSVRVQDLGAILGVSERQLQRSFLREVGVSPKLLARIARFHEVYQALERGGPAAGVAIDLGYFDQSHLIRDFRQFAGRSPRAAEERELLSRMFSGRSPRSEENGR